MPWLAGQPREPAGFPVDDRRVLTSGGSPAAVEAPTRRADTPAKPTTCARTSPSRSPSLTILRSLNDNRLTRTIVTAPSGVAESLGIAVRGRAIIADWFAWLLAWLFGTEGLHAGVNRACGTVRPWISDVDVALGSFGIVALFFRCRARLLADGRSPRITKKRRSSFEPGATTSACDWSTRRSPVTGGTSRGGV